MLLSRIVIQNFRSLKSIDVPIVEQSSCITGENNTGKSNLIQALRICLDINLSSSNRTLTADDIHADVDFSDPCQVLIGVEFKEFDGQDNEEAMLHGTQIGTNRARIFYRFRPKRSVRESIAAAEVEYGTLTLEDYSWELAGGGNPEVDLTRIRWDTECDEIGAKVIGLQYLQSYLVVYLHALRDVESDLQQYKKSPLAKLINATDIDDTEKAKLVAALQLANDAIEASNTVTDISDAVDSALAEITGPAFGLGVDLGLGEPTFESIVRNIKVLLSSATVDKFEPRHNGLGLNNALYISILIEYFRKRHAAGRSSGELILIEEPEAHLHPQLQVTLLEALRSLPFQSILTTHSAQITSKAPLRSNLFLTKSRRGTFASTVMGDGSITPTEIDDLERYLDATKSNLLFARKVMLVEGPAEVFLIPTLVKKVMGMDLERLGISVISIHGAHFSAYTKLFSNTQLAKKCAVVGDADIPPTEVVAGDDVPLPKNLLSLQTDFVSVFVGATTFERELVTEQNLNMLSQAAAELGAPQVAFELETATLLGIDDALKDKVLRTAKRFGKARYSQICARHSTATCAVPEYIENAVRWLTA